MSALTMLVLSMLVLAVFLCSAAFLSFMIALTYPTVKQSLALFCAGKRDASLYVDFAIFGGSSRVASSRSHSGRWSWPSTFPALRTPLYTRPPCLARGWATGWADEPRAFHLVCPRRSSRA